MSAVDLRTLSSMPYRARREARTILGRWPSAARRFRTGEFPTAATEICIEGFLRSGNTFTVIAFKHVQPRVVSVAHHVHAPGAVIAAVKMGTPTLVLIRPPEQSVLSFVIRWPTLTIGQALRGYVRFYDPLVAYRDRFVVGRFDEVTNDLGAAIRRVNERFGTDFVAYEPTPENERAVRAELDVWDANTNRQEGGDAELGRGRPTEEKEARKAELRHRYRSRIHARTRAKAEALHRTITR
ncbi:MAG: hypothetical protein ACXVQU_02250 [Actinomycetota bacterium]